MTSPSSETHFADLLERHPRIEPVHLGPTWERVPDWHEGLPETAWYVLPEITLGWEILAWIKANLLNDQGGPFEPTFEQSRFILWWYAIDTRGRFIYRDGVLQRLKGWGKDPLCAVLSVVEFLGPCRFSHWALEDVPSKNLVAGDPVGKEHPRAWIQVAAVNLSQTRNTFTLFPGLLSKQCMADHGMNKSSIGKEIVYAHGGQRRIEAVTSSPKALEGGRPTFVVRNETQWWLANNAGHEMAEKIDGNLTKANDGQARGLSICNAFIPSEDSIGQRQREAWENEQAGLAIKTNVLYDSLEAPAGAKMGFAKREDGSIWTEDEVKAYIGAVVRSVRGDATWLDIEGIVNSILSATNSPSESRRKFYNQVNAAEDAWLDPGAIKASVSPLAADARKLIGADSLRCGWLVMPEDEIVAFFDGSKSDDSTGLMGCRLSDGYVFTLGVWAKPAGELGKTWLSPRNEVDARVREMFERFNVVAFFGDPSHALDDDASRYWDATIDEWHRKYKDRLQVWSTKSGDGAHSILWDMASPERTRLFTGAAEQFVEEMQQQGDEGFNPAFEHDGNPALMAHLGNAQRYPNRHGVSLWKGARGGARKIDLAVCAAGARMLRRLVLNKGLEEDDKKIGTFWGV